MMPSKLPVVLDFDSSVSDIPGALQLPLQNWQEPIRFGCRWSTFKRLSQYLNQVLPSQYGCVFTGSGDYHHITQLLLQHKKEARPFQLIVCDNHPDNMRYPFGIHCGSWVYWASRLPQISHIHVLGISSRDISSAHAWENHWRPLLRGRLTYWNLQVNARWLNKVGAENSNRAFSDPDQMISTFLRNMDAENVYLSIDKDVFSNKVVNTNWDQSCLLESHIQQVIDACQGRLIGADITGDVSSYHYQSRFKRWLSAADGQDEVPAETALQWQIKQNQLNQRLLSRINRCWR